MSSTSQLFKNVQKYFADRNYKLPHQVFYNDGDFDDDIQRQFSQKERVANKPLVSTEIDLVTFLKKENLSDEEIENIRIFDYSKQQIQDVEVEYYLLHYDDVDTLTEKTEKYRGLILKKKNNEIKSVCQCFSYTPEYLVGVRLNYVTDNDIARITYAYEGPLARFWYDEEKWHFSTQKKINGRNSRWGGPTFGSVFDTFGLDTEKLDTSKCYIFLIEHQDLSTVIQANSILWLIGVFDKYGQRVYNSDRFDPIEIPVFLPEDLSTWQKAEDMAKEVDPYRQAGVIVHTKNGKCFKLLNEQYYWNRTFRGNEASAAIRYLQLRVENQQHLLTELCPRFKTKFIEIEETIPKIEEYLCRLWYKNHVQGLIQELPQKEYLLLKKLRQRQTNHLNPKNIEHSVQIIKQACHGLEARQINGFIKGTKFYLESLKKEQQTDEINNFF